VTAAGSTAAEDAAELRRLRQENAESRRANETLKTRRDERAGGERHHRSPVSYVTLGALSRASGRRAIGARDLLALPSS
jgi:transposase-like protein